MPVRVEIFGGSMFEERRSDGLDPSEDNRTPGVFWVGLTQNQIKENLNKMRHSSDPLIAHVIQRDYLLLEYQAHLRGKSVQDWIIGFVESVKGGSVVLYDRWTAYFLIPDSSVGLSVVQDGFFSDDGSGNQERYVLKGGDSIFAEGEGGSIDRVRFIGDGLLMPLLHGAEGDWGIGQRAVQSLLNSGVRLVVLEQNQPLASKFCDYVNSLFAAVNAGTVSLNPPSNEGWARS